ncbi:unnamed protein product [Didymodactylos carnosus]|uniref:Uncharacterized protein n=1 Tax=Didymodactylos carnosus TaxID=1234261 RepID=A0A8S2CME9_9BILA|nr:unnamed protein product [Didymodactylos carnosus]CAF3528174.1 unnamed protein product [Didymodactylos carnosus]
MADSTSLINDSTTTTDVLLEDDTNQDERLHCSLCKQLNSQPKILQCLHVYCLQCLKTKQEQNTISCPECQQITQLQTGVLEDDLFDDMVLLNEVELRLIQNGLVRCTSCRTEELAFARCKQCSTYLCQQCVHAHQNMKCFLNHTVVNLTDLTSFDRCTACPVHPSKELKYYSASLGQLLCDECLDKHPQSSYEKISPQFIEQLKEDLEGKMKIGTTRIDNAQSSVDAKLNQLQTDYEQTKEKLQENFQLFQKILTKIYSDQLTSLSDIQRSLEMKLLDEIHLVQMTTQRFEDAKDFTKRILAQSSGVELVKMKLLIDRQLVFLNENISLTDGDQSFSSSSSQIDFIQSTSNNDIEQVFKQQFGKLISAAEKQQHDNEKNEDEENKQQQEELFSLSGLSSDHSATTLSSASIDPLAYYVDKPHIQHFNGFSCVPSHGGDATPSLTNTTLTTSGSTSAAVPSQQPTVDLHGTSPFVNSIQTENIRALESIFNQQSHAQQQFQPIQHNPTLDFSQQNNETFSMTGYKSLQQNGRQCHSPLQLPTNGFPGRVPNYAASSHNGSSVGNSPRSTTPYSQLPLVPPTQPQFFSFGMPQHATQQGNCQSMQVRSKFGSLGPQKGQFNSPHGFCLGQDEEIIVADTNNHRIQLFNIQGEYKSQFGIPGREEGQLWYPRKVAYIKQSLGGKYVICDRGNERSRMQLFTRNGHFIKKISIRYIDIVAGLAITHYGDIVVCDSVSPTVFTISSETGELLKWFDCSDYMREPSDIATYQQHYFVCDFKGHCVCVFDDCGKFLRRIGNENITNFPNGIDISDEGDIVIGDSHGNRFHLSVYSCEGDLIKEFECPSHKMNLNLRFLTKRISSLLRFNSSTTETTLKDSTKTKSVRGWRKYLHLLKDRPASHITAFAILHELTAIGAFPIVYYPLKWSQWGQYIPVPTHYIEEGYRFISRVRQRYGYSSLDPGNPVLLNLSLTYGIVKLLLPLRIGLSLYLTPAFARLVVLPIVDPCRKFFRYLVFRLRNKS